jgi:hypothetical protein
MNCGSSHPGNAFGASQLIIMHQVCQLPFALCVTFILVDIQPAALMNSALNSFPTAKESKSTTWTTHNFGPGLKVKIILELVMNHLLSHWLRMQVSSWVTPTF